MRELDEGKYVGVILLDFSKAFDTISHQKLMQILCQLNLSNSVIQLFYNYLSDRYQRVMGKEEVSTWESVSRGVPQGSWLSPLLFSLYVKDLSTSNNADTFQFADDTGHSASAENAEILAMELTESFNHTKKFAEENGLILNAAKTQLIVFKQPSKKLSDSFELLLDSEVVKPTDTVKLLGFTLDRHFTFTQHIQSCVQKAHAALGLLWKAVKWMPREISKMAYTALARSQLEYCCMIFAGASITNQQKLEVVQKIAARIICELPRDTHATPLLEALQLVELRDRRAELMMKMAENILQGNCHVPCLKNLFSLNEQHKIVEQNNRTVIGKRRFSAIAAGLYNRKVWKQSTRVRQVNSRSGRAAGNFWKWNRKNQIWTVRKNKQESSTKDIEAEHLSSLKKIDPSIHPFCW